MKKAIIDMKMILLKECFLRGFLYAMHDKKLKLYGIDFQLNKC
jgi:hypothetical protein